LICGKRSSSVRFTDAEVSASDCDEAGAAVDTKLNSASDKPMTRATPTPRFLIWQKMR
jgi:hypothetical protein